MSERTPRKPSYTTTTAGGGGGATPLGAKTSVQRGEEPASASNDGRRILSASPQRGDRKAIELDRAKYLCAMDRSRQREKGEAEIRDAKVKHHNATNKVKREISTLERRAKLEHESLTEEEKRDIDKQLAEKALQLQQMNEDHDKEIAVLEYQLVKLSTEDLLYVRGKIAHRSIEQYKYVNRRVSKDERRNENRSIADFYMDFFGAHASALLREKNNKDNASDEGAGEEHEGTKASDQVVSPSRQGYSSSSSIKSPTTPSTEKKSYQRKKGYGTATGPTDQAPTSPKTPKNEQTPQYKQNEEDHSVPFEELNHNEIEALKLLIRKVDFNGSGKVEAEDFETLIRKYLFASTGISSLEVERVMLLLGIERFESKVYTRVQFYETGMQLFELVLEKRDEFEEVQLLPPKELKVRRTEIDRCLEEKEQFETDFAHDIATAQKALHNESRSSGAFLRSASAPSGDDEFDERQDERREDAQKEIDRLKSERRQKRINWAAYATIATAFEETKYRSSKLASMKSINDFDSNVGGEHQSTSSPVRARREPTSEEQEKQRAEEERRSELPHVHGGPSIFNKYFRKERAARRKDEDEAAKPDPGQHKQRNRSREDSLRDAFLRAPLSGNPDDLPDEVLQDMFRLFAAISGHQGEFMTSGELAALFGLFTPSGSDAGEVELFLREECALGPYAEYDDEVGLSFKDFCHLGPIVRSRAVRPREFKALPVRERQEIIDSKHERGVPLAKYEAEFEREQKTMNNQRKETKQKSRTQRFATSSFLSKPHPTARKENPTPEESFQENIGFQLRSKRRERLHSAGRSTVSPAASRPGTSDRRNNSTTQPRPQEHESVDWEEENRSKRNSPQHSDDGRPPLPPPSREGSRPGSSRRVQKSGGRPGSNRSNNAHQRTKVASARTSRGAASGYDNPALGEVSKQLDHHEKDDNLVHELADLYALAAAERGASPGMTDRNTPTSPSRWGGGWTL